MEACRAQLVHGGAAAVLGLAFLVLVWQIIAAKTGNSRRRW
jgi:hypothetical protein